MTRTELYYFAMYFFVYGFLGWCTEVAFAAWKTHHFVNRGFLNGPICPIYGIGVGLVLQFLTPYKSNLILLYIASIILVTAIEWLTGFVLEKVFHNKWWDYSDMPLNLNGYVCLLFSLIWGIACVFIVDFIQPVIHGLLTHIPFRLGAVCIIILGIAMFSDLYVTASGILKMNRRLEKMQEIADELHQISDHLGKHIYQNTINAMEAQEELKESIAERQTEFKETLDNVSDDVKEHITELHRRYRESIEDTTRIQLRLLRAFPRMESRQHKEILDDLRRRLKERDQNFRKK